MLRAAAVAFCTLPLLAEGFHILPWTPALAASGRRGQYHGAAAAAAPREISRRGLLSGGLAMTASKDKVELGEAAGEAVCFDGGCMALDPEHSRGMDMVEAELRDLSEVEARLRREGAMMLLEKLQASAAALPKDEAASVSIIKRKLAGRAGPTVWSEFGALAAETGGINLGQGFPNWSPPDFVMGMRPSASFSLCLRY